MNEKDRFLRELGHRIAEARKREGLTQAQLGEMVGTSQQIIANYETGTRHIPVWRLVRVAEVLGVGIDELAGAEKRTPAKRAGPPACGAKRSLRRGPTPKIQKQLEAIAGLPKEKRRFVEEVLSNILKGAEEQGRA